MKTKFRFSAVIFSCIIVFLLALVHLYSPSVDAANSGKNVAISITPSPVPQRSKTDAISTITGKPVSETNQVHAFAALPSIPTPNTSSQFEYTENIVVPSDGSTVQSQSLINGVAYTVTISGTFIWGNCDPVTCPNDAPDYKRYGDAGYLTDDHWASFADPGWSNIIYFVINGSKFTPSSYSSSHIYTTTITGTGSPASFKINDCPYCYGDNVGSLNVSITGIINTPVILIPGVMGSDFTVNQTFNPNIYNCLIGGNYSYSQNDLVWLDVNKLLTNYVPCGSKYLDVLKLQNDGQTPVYPQVSLKGTIISNPYSDTGDANSTISYLQQHGYTLGVNLFVFPYDWRKDISQTTSLLDNNITSILSQTGSTKVSILTHSMGGLVARAYISNSTRAQKVDTLVELGTPHVGSVDAIANLLFPTCITAIGPICAVSGSEVNSLVQNFPALFELLPSRLYYSLTSLYPFNDLLDMDNNGVRGFLSYDQFHTLLSNIGKNMSAFNMADAFHTTVDPTYSNTNGVTTYIIAGSGYPTMGSIFTYVWNVLGISKYDAIMVNGDGTVPLNSATLNQTTNVFYANEQHVPLAKNGPALTMAVNLLNGQTALISGIQTTPFSMNGEVVSIHSPAQLDAYDSSNNHTGKNADGSYEENIPGSEYFELGDAKFIYLPTGGSYHTTTQALAVGNFDLKLNDYTNDSLTQQNLYLNVAQTAQTKTSMTLGTSSPTLSVDVNGDGTNVQQVSATYDLTGSASADLMPPITSAPVSTKNSDGSYTNPAYVTLSATASAGFTVVSTYYTIDGGAKQTYTAPFTVSGLGSHTIAYWSVDNAGLTEAQKTKTFSIRAMIYDDSYLAHWTDTSFDTIDGTTTQTPNVYSVTGALVAAIGANGGEDFQSSLGQNTAGTDTLHFALKASQAGQQYDVYVDSVAGQPLATPVSLANYGGQPNASGWTLYNIPLAVLGASNVTIHDIVIHNPTAIDAPVLYIDQVELSNGSVTSLTNSVADDWSSGIINAAKWNNWGGSHASVVSSQLQISSGLTSALYGVDSSASGAFQDLTGSSVSNQLVNAGNQGLTSWEADPVVVHPLNDTNNQVEFSVSNNVLYAKEMLAGYSSTLQSATYSATTHKYFRIRENNGAVFFDTSADGLSWLQFTSITDPFDLTHVTIGQQAGTANTETSTTTAIFDNFNILPVTAATSSLSDDWSSGSISSSKWNNWGGAQDTVVSGQLKITTTKAAGTFGVDSNVSGKIYNLTGSYVSNQLVNAGSQTITSYQVYPIIITQTANSNNQLTFSISNNNLHARKIVGGVSTDLRNATYNATTEKYFRIREIAGVTYFDTSTDGHTWTNYTFTTTPFDVSNVKIGQQAGTTSRENSTTAAIFDNFDITP